MTSDEIIAAAREIVAENEQNGRCDEVDDLWTKVDAMAHELLRLHDGAEALRAENERLKQVCIEPYPSDVAVSGPSAPSCDNVGQLIKLLVTIKERWGDTAIQYRVSWGGSSLWAQDDLRKEIDRLAAELAEAKAELAELKQVAKEYPCPNPKGLECRVCYLLNGGK